VCCCGAVIELNIVCDWVFGSLSRASMNSRISVADEAEVNVIRGVGGIPYALGEC
jgi:hypothetical protein